MVALATVLVLVTVAVVVQGFLLMVALGALGLSVGLGSAVAASALLDLWLAVQQGAFR